MGEHALKSDHTPSSRGWLGRLGHLINQPLLKVFPPQARLEFDLDLMPNSNLLRVRPFLVRGHDRAALEQLDLTDDGHLQTDDGPVELDPGDQAIVRKIHEYRPLSLGLKGLVISSGEIPELLAFLRTSRTVAPPRETAEPAEVQVNGQALIAAVCVEYNLDDDLVVQAGFDTPDTGRFVAVPDVALDPKGRWARVGTLYYRPAEAVSKPAAAYFKGDGLTIITGEDIPEFLTGELIELQGEVRVHLDAQVRRTRVITTSAQPEMHLEMDDAGDLQAEVYLQQGERKLRERTLRDLPKRQHYVRLGEDWLRVDRDALKAVRDGLSQAKFRPDDHGTLACRGDDVPRFLQQALPELDNVWNVYRDEAVEQARVIDEPFRAKVNVRADDAREWLWFDVSYQAGDKAVSFGQVEDVPRRGDYVRDGTTWVKIDRDTHNKVRHIAKSQRLKRTGSALGAAGEQFARLNKLFSTVGTVEHTEAYESFVDRLGRFQEIKAVPLPTRFEGELRPYQKHGYHWLQFLYQYGLNGILADDMGLGKTVQALAHLARLREVEGQAPTLVVCPTSLVGNWRKEAHKFCPHLRVMAYTGPNRAKLLEVAPLADIVLTTYHTLWRDVDELKGISWRYVVLDEAQAIKNPETRIARACKVVPARSRLAITGTPIENRLSELWSIFDFLMPQYLGRHQEFRWEYEMPIMRAHDTQRTRELHSMVSPFVMRRLKAQVATELPDKVQEVLPCYLTDEQVRLYQQIATGERDRVLRHVQTKGIANSQVAILSAITRLKQLCDHPALITKDPENYAGRSGKFDAFCELLSEALDAGDKVLVFSQFTSMLEIIQRYLQDHRVGHLYLHGGTRDRDTLVDRFQSEPDARVFLLSLRAGGVGLNLTAANRVIHYDRWWNPAVENQATDRAHRIGQTQTVFVYKLLTEGTVEEKIHQMQIDKAELLDSIVKVDEAMFKTISRDDLVELFTLDRAEWTRDG